MSKRLEIAGTGNVWIIQKCIECQLLDSDACCVIDNKHRPKFDEECENCPLPDATEAPADVWPDDENHRLSPNGERLIAVSGSNCGKCFCSPILSALCVSVKCAASSRLDDRDVRFELAGDRT